MPDLTQTIDLLSVFADPTRVRLVALLDRSELSVAELTRITDLPQPRVSTHLRRLKDAGLVRDRRDGSSNFYSVDVDNMGESARSLWKLVDAGVEDELMAQDQRRREAALALRETPLRWPDEVAGQMERHYSPGRTWEAAARGLLGFLRLGRVLDIGSGDGVNAELIANQVESLTCLDISERVIAAARRRLERFSHVDFRVGDMHDIPAADHSFDAVLSLHVLTYSREPAKAIREAARVLVPGGSLALVTLAAHTHTKIAAAYDHVNDGFSPSSLAAMLVAAGLHVQRCAPSSRERRKPNFEVVTAFATKPTAP